MNQSTEIMDIKEWYKVQKTNNLIISAAYYKLTAIEQKIILIVVSLIDPKKDKDLKTYKIKVETIQALLKAEKMKGFKNRLKKITKSILSKPVSFDILDGKGKNITIQGSAWFTICKYIDAIDVVEFHIHKDFKPFLLDLRERYTSYELGYAVRLRSKYSIRMYEILKSYKWKKQPIGIYINELRDMLSIRKSMFTRYSNFKEKVLEKAKKELKEKTDLKFTYKEKKEGYKINLIMFTIKDNEKFSKLEEETFDMFDLNNTCYKLIELGLSEKQAQEFVKTKDKEYITDKINQLEYVLEKNPNKVYGKNNEYGKGQYLYNALMGKLKDDGYEEYKQKKEKEKVIKEKKERERKEKELMKEYEIYIENHCLSYNQLSKKEQEKIDMQIEEWKKGINKKIFKNNEKLEELIEIKREEIVKEQEKEKQLTFQEWIEKFN